MGAGNPKRRFGSYVPFDSMDLSAFQVIGGAVEQRVCVVAGKIQITVLYLVYVVLLLLSKLAGQPERSSQKKRGTRGFGRERHSFPLGRVG
jgi:hypothetical protein